MIFKNNYELRKYLSSLSSTKYEQFNRKIVPSEKEMLGVTTPNLRLIAKNTVKHSLYDFLSILTDQTFEEIMLFGFAIGYAYVSLKDRCVLIDRYLDMVDNWAHIDSVVSTCKFIKKEKVEFLPQIEKYLQSDKEFTVRFALVCLLDYYITEDYLDYIFDKIENVDNSKYYISMASAWLISVCFIKFNERTAKFIEKTSTDSFTVNRAIQKICDSYRVDFTVKENIKKLKRKI